MALGPDMPDEPPLRSSKSAAAFRTISEVAEELEVPQHVLRFWETKFTQIRPLKRAGGRRYYRPADVDLLRKVSRLLYHEGYTIKGVQRLLRERGGKQAATETPTALPFDFIDNKASFNDEAAFVPDAKVMAEPEIAAKPAPPKRLDRASRVILETLLDDLLELRAVLKPGQD